MMGGAGSGPGTMMGSGAGRSGAGPVDDLDGARRAADRFAQARGLSVGEVMEFENGFYAELADPAGQLATEVLIDPGTGAVQLEFGPAMMWNTGYGVHPGRTSGLPTIEPEEAQRIAAEWLADNRPGEQAGEPDAFPGYYTLHTEEGGRITGMLSVHATSGAVWFHSWHGGFVAAAHAE